jgi:hypothetical protein
MDTFGRDVHRRRLSPWLTKAFRIKRDSWLTRDLSKADFPIFWVDKVDLGRQGPEANYRIFVVAALTVNGLTKLVSVQQSGNLDDHCSWRLMFDRLKSQGVEKLPPVTGVIERDVVKGIREAYPEFETVSPPEEHVRWILSRIPKQRYRVGRTICEAIIRTKSPRRYNQYVALFVKTFALTDPRLVIDFLNHERFDYSDKADKPANAVENKG